MANERWYKRMLRPHSQGGRRAALRITTEHPEGYGHQEFELPEWLVDRIIADHAQAALLEQAEKALGQIVAEAEGCERRQVDPYDWQTAIDQAIQDKLLDHAELARATLDALREGKA